MKRLILLPLVALLASCVPTSPLIGVNEEGTISEQDTNVLVAAKEKSAATSEPSEEEAWRTDAKTLIQQLTDDQEEFESVWNKEVTFDYPGYQTKTVDNNLMSRYQKIYDGINGGPVQAEFFYVEPHGAINHPNIGLGLMLYQAILYKIAHPEIENEISISSFRFSVIAGLNLVRSSPYFGTMKSMPYDRMDRDGFVRFSYLLIIAAKLGIKINFIAQLRGYSDYGQEIEPGPYFYGQLNQPCFKKVGLGESKVGDFMKFRFCEWVSYDGKSASDMYHVKGIAVRHFQTVDGDREYGVFLSSSNLDGVCTNGTGGQRGAQTGIAITNHKWLYHSLTNFIRFTQDYCGQDDSYEFRIRYIQEVIRQKNHIKQFGYEGMEDSLLVYLGTDEDPVFQLYFTPFSDNPGAWTDDNPFCRYVDKLKSSKTSISVRWHNPKFSTNFEFINVLCKKIVGAFMVDRGLDQNLQNHLEMPILGPFAKIKVGVHAGAKLVGGRGYPHEKDCIFTYEENGVNHKVGIMNSLNVHQGAFWYQTNSVLVIHEDDIVGTDFISKFIETW